MLMELQLDNKLKRSTVSISEGIRQNITNQRKEFIENFFSTIQLVFAGNDTEGLSYGTIRTPERFFLKLKEYSVIDNNLDSAITQMCSKDRLLEIIRDFIVYDKGVKKICRSNQYFGVKEAQKFALDREGGIIWHTQGSGKSLTMVWLAKWIRENITSSRILILTDRTELDEQIEKVSRELMRRFFEQKGEILVNELNKSEKSLICSLIHKFGSSEKTETEAFIEDIRNTSVNFKPRRDFRIY